MSYFKLKSPCVLCCSTQHTKWDKIVLYVAELDVAEVLNEPRKWAAGILRCLQIWQCVCWQIGCQNFCFWKFKFKESKCEEGDRGSTVVKVLCYKSAGSWFDPSWCHWSFFIDIKSFRSHYGPGVDSASNRNEYQEFFLGVKVAGV